MQNTRQQALKLRLSGRSYGEITKELGVPKSTLSGWLGGVVLSDYLRLDLEKRTSKASQDALSKYQKLQRRDAEKRVVENKKIGVSLLNKSSNKELMILGTSLYWAEGYKKQKVLNGRTLLNHPVYLTNSDPRIIKVFIRYLKEIYKIQDSSIKVHVRVFPHQNPEAVLTYWKEVTGLTDINFLKPTVTVSLSGAGKRPYNTLPNGVAQVRVYNTDLFYKIMGAIEAFDELV